jgi:hypothetical protein
MLRSDERWVIHMEAAVRFVPHDAPNELPMDDLTEALVGIPGTTTAIHRVDAKNGDEIVTLDEVALYPANAPVALVMLFSFTNKIAADPGFRNVETGDNRVESKRKNEGVSSSAHLVIKLKQKTHNKRSYWPALLEDVQGIGKTKIQAALTFMLNEACEFPYEDEEEEDQLASARFTLHGQESEDLQKDLANGKLSYFVAIKDQQKPTKFDGVDGLKTGSETLRLKPDKNVDTADGIAKYIKKVSDACKAKGYTRLQVHYQRVDGKNRSLTFGTQREDAEDFLIKKVELITLEDVELSHVHTNIVNELVDEMIKKLP